MAAERLQSHPFRVARLPTVELVANEADLLPEAPHDPRGALRCDLDDRCDDLDYAAVEVDRAAGGQLRGLGAAMKQGPLDERGRRAPVGFRLDRLVVDEDLELGLETDHRHSELVAIRESKGIVGHNLGRPASSKDRAGRDYLRMIRNCTVSSWETSFGWPFSSLNGRKRQLRIARTVSF